MEDCMQGLEIRRVWSELENVVSFGGKMMPGTPDGMYEDHQGRLTCVQVVRLPITKDMSDREIEQVVYQTVLEKIKKSQQWMLAAHQLPYEFIIFCWLPFQPSDFCGQRTQALVDRMRAQGWPFCLRVKLAADPGSLFPTKFAWRRLGRDGGANGCRSRKRPVSEDDLSTMDLEDFRNTVDSEDCYDWDIFSESTWEGTSQFSSSLECSSSPEFSSSPVPMLPEILEQPIIEGMEAEAVLSEIAKQPVADGLDSVNVHCSVMQSRPLEFLFGSVLQPWFRRACLIYLWMKSGCFLESWRKRWLAP